MQALIISVLCLTAVWAKPIEEIPALQRYVPFNEVPRPVLRIINGKPATDGQFPWQVGIYAHTAVDTKFCGGSLISNEWVLTAAQCLDGYITFESLLGSVNIDTPQIRINSISAIIHPNYNRNTHANDIGLIRLATPVLFGDNIKRINLASVVLDANVVVTVSGWGTTVNDGPDSKALNYVQLSTISNTVCSQTYGTLDASIVCCEGATIESTCGSDSGGPVVTNPTTNPVQVGTVSFGSSAGCTMGYPVGFQRVAVHRTWITEMSGV